MGNTKDVNPPAPILSGFVSTEFMVGFLHNPRNSKDRVKVPKYTKTSLWSSETKSKSIRSQFVESFFVLNQKPMVSLERSPYPYNPWDWYIYLQLADFYSKCIGKYPVHGWCGFDSNKKTTFINHNASKIKDNASNCGPNNSRHSLHPSCATGILEIAPTTGPAHLSTTTTTKFRLRCFRK